VNLRILGGWVAGFVLVYIMVNIGNPHPIAIFIFLAAAKKIKMAYEIG